MEKTAPKIKINYDNGLIFTLKKEKKYNSTTTGKQYSYVYSERKTKMLFNEIMTSIPKWRGSVNIYGETLDQKRPVDCVCSSNNLREEFSKNLKKSTVSEGKVDRFRWLVELLSRKEFNKLKICTTSVF